MQRRAEKVQKWHKEETKSTRIHVVEGCVAGDIELWKMNHHQWLFGVWCVHCQSLAPPPPPLHLTYLLVQSPHMPPLDYFSLNNPHKTLHQTFSWKCFAASTPRRSTPPLLPPSLPLWYDCWFPGNRFVQCRAGTGRHWWINTDGRRSAGGREGDDERLRLGNAAADA